MKEKWEKPLISELSLRNTQTPGAKAATEPFEQTVVKDGKTIATTSS